MRKNWRGEINFSLRHGGFSVNLLHIFRTAFPKNAFGRLILNNNQQHLKKELIYLPMEFY